ncbi:hypothetical protein ACYSNW_12845 [Enterococcus sp. LJL99]
MSFFTNKTLSEQEHLNLFKPQKITVILENQTSIESDLTFIMEQLLAKNGKSTVGLISKENIFFPYLSLKDNLFITSEIKEKNRKTALNELLLQFQISPNTLFKSYEQLTKYEQIQLQLMQIVLSNKNEIIIEDIFSDLSIYQRQHLLPLLKQISNKKEKAILLFTSDQQIAESSYIDKVITPVSINC